MCPFCISNLALLTVGVVSTGGATALVAGKLRAKNKAAEISRKFRNRITARAQRPNRKRRVLQVLSSNPTEFTSFKYLDHRKEIS